MSLAGIERRIGAPSFARLLGDWRPPDGRGLAEALADRIRLLVLDGRLPLETRLPAERELAAALAVSRTTVAGAYEALRSAGVLRSRRGAGSWTRLPPAQANGTSPSPFSPLGGSPLYDLAHAALPAPRGPVRTAAAAAVHDLDALLAGHGYDLSGQPALRAAIADRYTARGLPTTPDQVLVTAGGVHGIHLALMVLAGPGDRVLVEHPTYPNAITAVTARGTRPVPVPMAPDGVGGSSWDLDLLTSAVRDAAPRLAYVIPDFQNPTGALLAGADRARLVDLARRTGTTLLVDETLADLTLEGPSELPVAAHGGAGASTLAVLLGGTDIGCRWPQPGRSEPAGVVLVARTHAGGLRAASRALNALREGRHPPGMRLVALVLVADAPGRLPLTLTRRIRVLRSVTPVFRVPWVPAWRLGKQTGQLPKSMGKLGALVAQHAGEGR